MGSDIRRFQTLENVALRKLYHNSCQISHTLGREKRRNFSLKTSEGGCSDKTFHSLRHTEHTHRCTKFTEGGCMHLLSNQRLSSFLEAIMTCAGSEEIGLQFVSFPKGD